MDDRFTQDNYYRRGQFNVLLDVEPMGEELDEKARRRALQELLYALRDETGLKISSFVDLYEVVTPEDEIEEVPEDIVEEDLDDEELVEAATNEEDDLDGEPLEATAEFVVYNKLGVSALGKLKRFTDNHLRGDITPQIVLVDPVTNQKFKTTRYRIQYLFHYFTAGQPPNDWARLKELVSQDDRGYAELIRKAAMRIRRAEETTLRVRRGKFTFSLEEVEKVGEAIGIDWDEVDFEPVDLQVGMEVELEHGSSLGEEVNVTGDDPEATAMIAWAHLMESPKYYDLLAEMEQKFEEPEDKEASTRDRPGYTRVVEPGKRGKEPLSSDFQGYVTDYLKKVTEAVDSGKSANEAFKEIRPSLDHLQPHQMISTLWDNQALGKLSPASLGNIAGLDFYDVLQKLFERKVYELAVQWWGQQRTMRQVEQMREEAPAKPASEDADEEGTVVLKKPAHVIKHKGHFYREV